jgi:hypothetical protein
LPINLAVARNAIKDEGSNYFNQLFPKKGRFAVQTDRISKGLPLFF